MVLPLWVFALAEIVLMLLPNAKTILNFHLHFLNVMYGGPQVKISISASCSVLVGPGMRGLARVSRSIRARRFIHVIL